MLITSEAASSMLGLSSAELAALSELRYPPLTVVWLTPEQPRYIAAEVERLWTVITQ